jgi:hypothetical protein
MFEQGNAKAHTARQIQDVLQQNNINDLEWSTR